MIKKSQPNVASPPLQKDPAVAAPLISSAWPRDPAALLLRAEDSDYFNRLTVGRELAMIELKKEINELCLQHGEPTRYPTRQGQQILGRIANA